MAEIEGFSAFETFARFGMITAPRSIFRAWRCNFDRIASIATRTFRPPHWKRVFAVTSARSAPTVSRAGLQMSVRIAEVDSFRGRSGPRGNGGCVDREAARFYAAGSSQI